MFIDFSKKLLIYKSSKRNSNYFIQSITDKPTKMVIYKPVKSIFDIIKLGKLIINIVVRYFDLLNSIFSN